MKSSGWIDVGECCEGDEGVMRERLCTRECNGGSDYGFEMV